MNIKNQKLDIIIVAGQSNAEGNGLSHDEEDAIIFSHDAYELIDCNDVYFQGTELILTMPIKSKIEPLQERMVDGRNIADLSLSFVDDYIKNGCLEKGRKVLVVKAAVGGTGFARNQQGIGNVIYERLLQLTDKALSLTKETNIVAFLWHQGEHDAFENAYLNNEERKSFYISKFVEQMTDYRKRYSNFDFPIITGGFVESWKKQYIEQTKAIEDALKESTIILGNSCFVSSDGLLSNDDVIHNKDDIHFSRESILELGHRYFKAYKELKK